MGSQNSNYFLSESVSLFVSEDDNSHFIEQLNESNGVRYINVCMNILDSL